MFDVVVLLDIRLEKNRDFRSIGTYVYINTKEPITVAARSKAARLLGLRVRIPPGPWMSVVSVVCFQVEVSATTSLVQCSPTECGVSECDRGVSIMRRPRPTRGCCTMGKRMRR
jgi:hypothetical protein